jgi:hypothetical protein
MTTRTPPTADDLAGTSERGRAAYNERRRSLRDRGIAVILDLYGDDVLDDETDPTGAQRFWRRYAAEEAQNITEERALTRVYDRAMDGVRRPQ